MVSKKLLDELDQILKEDYKLTLSPFDLANLAHSLKGYFECLREVYEAHKQ